MDITYGKNVPITTKFLSGRSKRQLIRMNTIHLRGVCPKCGDKNVRFYKELIFKGKKNQHNKWFCKKCSETYRREDLENVYYA